MTIDMITFVIIKDIYDYHDYNAYRLIAKAMNHNQNAIVISHSHNGLCILRLQSDIYIYI